MNNVLKARGMSFVMLVVAFLALVSVLLIFIGCGGMFDTAAGPEASAHKSSSREAPEGADNQGGPHSGADSSALAADPYIPVDPPASDKDRAARCLENGALWDGAVGRCYLPAGERGLCNDDSWYDAATNRCVKLNSSDPVRVSCGANEVYDRITGKCAPKPEMWQCQDGELRADCLPAAGGSDTLAAVTPPPGDPEKPCPAVWPVPEWCLK